MTSAVLSSATRKLGRVAAIGLSLIAWQGHAWTQASSGQTSSEVAAISADLRAQDFDGAIQLSANALKTSPRDIRLLTLRGMAYSAKNDSALALDAFNQALTISPDFLPALEAAAQVAYLHHGALARPYLLRILVSHPTEPTANAMLAVIDYRAGDCKGAIEHFEPALALLASQPDSLVEYGACLASANRLDAAIPVLQQAVNLKPADPVGRYNLALAQFNLNQTDAALTTLEPMIAEPSPPEDVLTLAADIYEAQNNTQRAVEVLRQAIVSHPKDKSAYLQFAYLSYKHSSVEVGVDMLNVGIAQLPNQAELYLARGVLRSQLSNASAASDDFGIALRLDPRLSFAGDAEGIAKSQAHDDKAALATFRVAAKQHPDDGLAQYLLAEAISQTAPIPGTPAFIEGVSAAKRSITLDPQRLEARDLLASLYLRADQIDLSIQESQAALKLDPNDEEALFHEILALRKGDRKSEVPALVQRMMKVREAKASEVKPKMYRLAESATPPNEDHPN
jgi:tetratricopeptide (TPR) repeat protein